MSQQCLPVVIRSQQQQQQGKKKRKRKNQQQQQQQRNDNNNNNNVIMFDDIETMDATEYLSRVVQQARKLPSIFISNSSNNNNNRNSNRPSKRQKIFIPIDGSAASVSYLISSKSSLTMAPTRNHLPQSNNNTNNNDNNTSMEWMEETLCNFEKLRQYLDDCRFQGVGGKNTNRQPLPSMKDRSGWHIFCVGKDDAHGNAGSYFGDDDDDDENDNDDEENDNENNKNTATTKKEKEEETSKITTNTKTEKEEQNENDININDNDDIPPKTLWQPNNIPETGHVPTVQLLLQMDQVLIRRVLSHLAFYVCSGWPLTEQRSLWLYALLARLEKPVHRDDAATLFSILKTLTLNRSKLQFSKTTTTTTTTTMTENNNNNNNADNDNQSRMETNHPIDENEKKNNVELAKLNSLIAVIGIYFEQSGRDILTKCKEQEPSV